MQFIRKTFLGFTASLLFVVLFSFGLAFSLQRVFSTPTAIKHAIKESGLYESAVKDALDQAQKDQQAQNGGATKDEIPLNRPEVQNVIQQAASPTFLQTQTEQVLDGVYAWLQGKTPQLVFAVDLTDVKARLADGVGQYAQQHLATLPACGSGVAVSTDVDPFNATCVPKGVDINKVASQAKDQVQNGEFLKESPKLTADSIKTENGKTLAQQLKAAPMVYKRVNQGVYAAGLLALLLALAVTFLSVGWRAGVRKVAITAIAIGLFSALLAWLSGFGVQRLAEQLTKTSGNIQPLQQKMLAGGQILVNDVRSWWLGYGIALMVLGVLALVILTLTEEKGPKPTKPAPQPANEPKPAPEDKPAQPATAPAPAPKPRPSKKLVQ